MSSETITYLAWIDGEVHRLTIPSSWTLTLSPKMVGTTARGQSAFQPDGDRPLYLRIYEGKKQRAAIPDVLRFVDERIGWETSVAHAALAKLNNGKVETTPL